MGKARMASMKVMIASNLELQAALLAASLKMRICRAPNITLKNVFICTDKHQASKLNQ